MAALILLVPIIPIGSSVVQALPAGQDPKAVSDLGRLSSDYSSIFTDPELVGSGWSQCDAPIIWNVDASALRDGNAASQIKSLQWAFNLWSKASGLTFKYGGLSPSGFAEVAADSTALDAATVKRQIHVDFVATGASKVLTGSIVGQGTPTARTIVREIVSGAAVFSADRIQHATPSEARSVYLHEIGHVLGLAHAHNRANIMFPVIGNRPRLGPGDVRGVRSLIKPCSLQEQAPARITPPVPTLPTLPVAPGLPPVVLPPIGIPVLTAP